VIETLFKDTPLRSRRQNDMYRKILQQCARTLAIFLPFKLASMHYNEYKARFS